MEKKEINNAKEFDEAIAKGKAVVDFYADWCNPCRMLAPVLDEVLSEKGDITLIRVNVDNVPELATRFNVYSIPCVYFFKDGQQVGNFIGFKYKAEVESALNEAYKD